jgi:hypothetical protein
MSTQEETVKRLADTKTIDELVTIRESLKASLLIAPPGEYYGRLFEGVLRVNLAIDLIKKREKP